MPLFLALLVFVAVSTITPGGATALAASSGMSHGFRRSSPLLAGLVCGLASMAGLSALGLGSLFLAYPPLRLALAAIATGYFAWLAWMIATSGAPDLENRKPAIGFGGGVALLWLNPKAWTTSLGAAATYGDVAPGPVMLALIFVPVFAALSAISLTLWCLGGSALARRLRTPGQWRVLNLMLAGFLLLSILSVWKDYL
ncbi:LysE family translocator [Salipiger mucosus]|uniref:Lysine exporter protein (LYSE/YGGA) n=1 Tax=Salipiger mucosus DSM 16094 TaxID=1123237 RepID=S9QA19_9RHOB|nr:LysE family translocator [Salipiger mucosus]EPX76473.1 Lysine exporter protein (LYSE/YGGA) [Salipiger mucosus DSM 16094]